MKTKPFGIVGRSPWRCGAATLCGWLMLAVLMAGWRAYAVDYTITATAGAGGLVFPSGAVKVAAGSQPTFFVIANDTYSVMDVKVNGTSVGGMAEVTLDPVGADGTLAASFVKGVSITASAGPGGAISPPGAQVVGYGGSRTFLMVASPGYKVAGVKVNGLPLALPGGVTNMFTWQVTNIIKASTISATFALDPTIAVVTATAGLGGTISPLGKTPVLKGSSQAFTVTPAYGYRVLDIKVDGKSAGQTSPYTLANVQAAHTVAATFVKLPVITAKQSAGGSITPAGATIVAYGGTQAYTITPDAGFDIASLLVNGKAVAAAGAYTFTNVTAATASISATFKIKPGQLLYTATSNAGGIMIPSGSVAVTPGTYRHFIADAQLYYCIQDFKVDGKSVPATSYGAYYDKLLTPTDTTVKHTITATFAKRPVINAVQAPGGSITPAGTSYETFGSSQAYTITPATGYDIASLVINGKAVPAAGTYTFTNIRASASISATFKVKSGYFGITATAGVNGAVTPAGLTSVVQGGAQTYDIAPATSAYRVLDVKVDGKSAGAVSTYTFTDVRAAHTISATFAIATHTVIASAPAGGTILPSGILNISDNKSQVFTVKPQAGSKAGIQVDGVLVAQEGTGKSLAYTLKNIVRDHNVAAVFVPLGGSFSGSAGLSLLGLGDSINVANVSPAPFTIEVYGASAGVSGVYYNNETSHAWGHATAGTRPNQWTAKVALTPGDNALTFLAVSVNGAVTTLSTTVTYYAALDFITPLMPSIISLVSGQDTAITWKLGLQNGDGAQVTLYQVAGDGSVFNGVPMTDGGAAPDETARDGIFTARATVNVPPGKARFRARVQKPGLADYYSEIKTFDAAPLLTHDQIVAAINLCNATITSYDAAVTGGSTAQEAANATAASLLQNPLVATAEASTNGSVWWSTVDGILAIHGQTTADVRGGTGGMSPTPPAAPVAAPAPPSLPGMWRDPFYPTADLATLFPPSASGRAESLSQVLTTQANRIKSDRAIIFSPAYGEFGPTDDYNRPWPLIADHKPCGLHGEAAFFDDGNTTFTLDNYKDLSSYGYIHFCTHGYAQERRSGPVVALKSGVEVRMTPDGNDYITTGLEADLKDERIALDSSLWLLPRFFKDYGGPLPNSLVVLSSCETAVNDSLIKVFRAKGAGAVLGYTNSVQGTYAQNIAEEIISRMYEDKTLEAGLLSAIDKYGSPDDNLTPAEPAYGGAADLKFPDEHSLPNGGFEDGVLTPWKSSTSAHVTGRLGTTKPRAGTRMGILATGSTGSGRQATNDSITQRVCISESGAQLVFDWNMYSSKWMEYLPYQDNYDYFAVTAAVVDPVTGKVSPNSQLLFYRDISDLAGSVVPSDVDFGNDDTFTTGWQTSSVDLYSFKGKAIELTFIMAQAGSFAEEYSAVLLDEIALLPVAAVK